MRIQALAGSLAAALVIGMLGCGSTPAAPSKYPARAEGCDVSVFHDTPSMPTDNIGPVNAYCGEDIKDEDCLRTLKDEVCKLGGDVVWGVAEKPSVSVGKKKYAGRAAHTTSAGGGGEKK